MDTKQDRKMIGACGECYRHFDDDDRCIECKRCPNCCEGLADSIFPHVPRTKGQVKDELYKRRLKHLNDQFGKSWAKEKPTKPGWYWYFDDEEFPPEILKINEDLMVVNVDITVPMEEYPGAWLGPLELPEKQNERS